TAIAYGCLALQRFEAVGVDVRTSGVTVTGRDGTRLSGRYLVDASGFRSPLAERYGLRTGPEALRHHSRSLFSHMSDVRPTDDVVEMAQEDRPPIPWVQGTMHHMFDRGWFWVIPFNNEPRSKNPLVSVGLTFDERRYPRDESLTPEEEFLAYADQFP